MLLVGAFIALLVATPVGSSVKWVPLKGAVSQQPQEPKAKPQPVPQTESLAPETAAQSPPPVTRANGQSPLRLTCLGAGTAEKATGAYVSGYGGSATILSRKDRDFQDQVDLRLFEGDDRIRMPRSMLPGIRGGQDGWFKLKNVVADARSIRGSAAVNVINNPKVFIDRVTGTISISGKSGDYSGQCEVIDAAAPAKF